MRVVWTGNRNPSDRLGIAVLERFTPQCPYERRLSHRPGSSFGCRCSTPGLSRNRPSQVLELQMDDFRVRQFAIALSPRNYSGEIFSLNKMLRNSKRPELAVLAIFLIVSLGVWAVWMHRWNAQVARRDEMNALYAIASGGDR